MSEKAYDYNDTIEQVCELLQTATTPEAINELSAGFNRLSQDLTPPLFLFLRVDGPFLEIFEAILTNISFSALFSLLAAPDNRLIVSVVELTEKLLEPVTWDMIHEKFENFICLGLDHPHTKVKILVLNQFLRCNLLSGKFNPNYAPSIWECLIGDSNSNHVNLSLNVLIHLSSYKNCAKFIYTEESLAVIHDILAMDTSHRFRVYDIVANTIINSEDATSIFEKNDILSKFASEFKSNDSLIIVNALELLPKMTQNKTAADYFISQNILDLLSDFIKDPEILGVKYDFLRSFSLKTFSKLINSKGLDFISISNKYSFINTLSKHLDQSSDITLRITSITCLGILALNSDFLKHLDTEYEILDQFLQILQSATGDVKLESLRTFSCILEKNPPIDTKVDEINQKLFKKCFAFLLKTIINNIEDQAIASFSVIQKFILYTWSHNIVSQSQSFLSFLVEKSDFSLTLQDLKFSVITVITKNEKFLESIPEPFSGKLLLAANKNTKIESDAIPSVATLTI
ncbi:hypothetical protein BB561_000472 [Smittium simulii]|uniref:Condensin complex subunit 1 C-terminal domain-containing protein n=1 Tax=Smittium simulii TaxID=133385 RepID=A0A2T9YYW0_9FUNG|nr:hypothetical protein BB561_000472 [Smittium simulii]